MSLTNVTVINTKQYAEVVKFAAKNNDNVLVLGPSGAGKTVICQNVAHEMNCRLVYINLSTLERTDFQGFPVVSEDKTSVQYATAEFMPFTDASFKKDKRVIKQAIHALVDKDGSLINPEDEALHLELEQKLADIIKQERLYHLNLALPYLKNSTKLYGRMKDMVKDLKSKSEMPIIVLFDEVDKAASETNQPLLEFLQFSSVNGRRMNIQACILTGNLPDENAHSNNISQAISKRCKSYKLEINFDMWRDWAFKNDVHDLIVQFLQNEPSMIYQQGSPDGDPTAYAQPAPRTWTQAGISLTKMDADKEYQSYSQKRLDKLRMLLISGAVGTAASAKWEAWYKYYREFDPAITELVEHGTFPEQNLKGRNLTDQEKLIIAISACSRHAKEIKEDNKEKLHKVTKNVYKWLITQLEEYQIAATRMSLSLTSDEEFQQKIKNHKLLEIPEFRDCFDKINKKFRAHGVTSKKQ